MGSSRCTRARYTSFYTSALRKRLLHSGDGAVLDVGQDVAVGGERYRDDNPKI